MAVRKKTVLLIVLFLGAFFCLCAYLAVRLFLPADPRLPYFPASVSRIPQVNWLLGRFQPVFLYPFSRGGSGFLRVAYRDSARHIRLMNIYVGPVASLVGVVDGQTAHQVTSLAGYWRYVRPGDRLSLTYLRTSAPRPGTPASSALSPSAPQAVQICAKLPQLCYLAQLAEANPGPYWDFHSSGRFPANALFLVVNINLNLVD